MCELCWKWNEKIRFSLKKKKKKFLSPRFSWWTNHIGCVVRYVAHKTERYPIRCDVKMEMDRNCFRLSNTYAKKTHTHTCQFIGNNNIHEKRANVTPIFHDRTQKWLQCVTVALGTHASDFVQPNQGKFIQLYHRRVFRFCECVWSLLYSQQHQ